MHGELSALGHRLSGILWASPIIAEKPVHESGNFEVRGIITSDLGLRTKITVWSNDMGSLYGEGSWPDAEGQVGFRPEELSGEGIPDRATMEQKGPSHASVLSEASFISSPLGQPSSWRRMSNAEVSTLAQKFVSLIVTAGSGKIVKSLKFICTIIHFPISNPPSFACAFLSVSKTCPPLPPHSANLQNMPHIAAFLILLHTLKIYIQIKFV